MGAWERQCDRLRLLHILCLLCASNRRAHVCLSALGLMSSSVVRVGSRINHYPF